jgi:hypothetical protein
VQFDGEGTGSEPLTWGQQSVWASMEYGDDVAEWTGGSMPLDQGQTTEDIVTLLRFIMTRHESLRTRFRRDDDGKPWQIVSASGEVALEVYDADPADDPAALAASIQTDYETAPYNFVTDWPVRMAVVRQHGKAVYFVAIYSHLVMDGYAIDALVADLANLDYTTGRHLAPVAGTTSLEQARFQRSPEGMRASEVTLSRWKRQLWTIPPKRFGASTDKREPRFWDATFASPATYLALPLIAERTKVHSGTILLAAYAIALGRISGQSPSVIRIIVSNRFRPGFAESVSAVMQSGLVIVDVADRTFDEVVADTFKSQLSAGVRGYYNPPDLWDLIKKVGEERGVTYDLLCYFNDRRRAFARPRTGPAPTKDELAAALATSTFRWSRQSDIPDATSSLLVNNVPDIIEFTMTGDTHALSPADTQNCLRDIEAMIVEAAFDPEVPSGVHQASETAALSL